MSSVPGAQLLAQGPQDVWLSGDPQVSFFRSVYRHHVPFGIELKKMNFDADGSCRFDRYGDLLGPCYITANDPATGRQIPLTSWTGLFETVDLTIGGQLVDSQDIPYSSQVWPVLESSTWSQRTLPTGFYPLHFFFCQDWSRAFPLVALEFHDLVIRIQRASPLYQFQLWSSIVHLDEGEREWFKMQTHQLLITRTQRTVITPNQNEFTRFSGPIKYLATEVFEYDRFYQPLFYPDPRVLDTTTTQTYTVTYYNPQNMPVVWTVVNALPIGVSVTGQTNTSITFTIAAGTLVTIQTFQVSVSTTQEAWVTRFESNGSVGSSAHAVYNNFSYNIGSYTSGPLKMYNSDGSVFPTSLASIGTSDSALTKIDANGKIIWGASIGGTGSSASANDIQIDDTGIYIVGTFLGTIGFNNSDGTPFGTTLTVIVPDSAGNGFLVKYSLDGNVQWCTKWGETTSTFYTRLWSIRIDSSGVYVSGRNVVTSIQFYNSDGTTNTVTPSASQAYIAKYDKNGFLIWRSIQTNAGENYALALVSNRVYISSGVGNTTVSFRNSNDTVSGTLVTSGTQNSYIGAYDATTGNLVWRARMGSISAGGAPGFIRQADSGADGGLYFIGIGTGTIYLYNSDGAQSAVSVSGIATYGFMASYDSNGTARWAIKIDGASRINAVSVYDGVVYVNGFIQGTLPCIFYNSDGSPYPYTFTRKGSSIDSYVAAYTSSGTVLWIVQGAASTANATTGRFGADKSAYLPGVFGGTNMKLYNQTGTNILAPLTLKGTQGAYLYKFKPW